ncbi:hypothetical protein QBC35DRAFT_263882 [Podospora australis]|uniref:Uncharacterized protein n=1 Tax=Podospora australis TaxID=1536484 RepID=A0AAN6X4T7_9PEZI|nr:hypothetical protein QBC35DRAFT_263882 [Podospora australis]
MTDQGFLVINQQPQRHAAPAAFRNIPSHPQPGGHPVPRMVDAVPRQVGGQQYLAKQAAPPPQYTTRRPAHYNDSRASDARERQRPLSIDEDDGVTYLVFRFEDDSRTGKAGEKSMSNWSCKPENPEMPKDHTKRRIYVLESEPLEDRMERLPKPAKKMIESQRADLQRSDGEQYQTELVQIDDVWVKLKDSKHNKEIGTPSIKRHSSGRRSPRTRDKDSNPKQYELVSVTTYYERRLITDPFNIVWNQENEAYVRQQGIEAHGRYEAEVKYEAEPTYQVGVRFGPEAGLRQQPARPDGQHQHVQFTPQPQVQFAQHTEPTETPYTRSPPFRNESPQAHGHQNGGSPSPPGKDRVQYHPPQHHPGQPPRPPSRGPAQIQQIPSRGQAPTPQPHHQRPPSHPQGQPFQPQGHFAHAQGPPNQGQGRVQGQPPRETTYPSRGGAPDVAVVNPPRQPGGIMKPVASHPPSAPGAPGSTDESINSEVFSAEDYDSDSASSEGSFVPLPNKVNTGGGANPLRPNVAAPPQFAKAQNQPRFQGTVPQFGMGQQQQQQQQQQQRQQPQPQHQPQPLKRRNSFMAPHPISVPRQPQVDTHEIYKDGFAAGCAAMREDAFAKVERLAAALETKLQISSRPLQPKIFQDVNRDRASPPIPLRRASLSISPSPPLSRFGSRRIPGSPVSDNQLDFDRSARRRYRSHSVDAHSFSPVRRRSRDREYRNVSGRPGDYEDDIEFSGDESVQDFDGRQRRPGSYSPIRREGRPRREAVVFVDDRHRPYRDRSRPEERDRDERRRRSGSFSPVGREGRPRKESVLFVDDRGRSYRETSRPEERHRRFSRERDMEDDRTRPRAEPAYSKGRRHRRDSRDSFDDEGKYQKARRSSGDAFVSRPDMRRAATMPHYESRPRERRYRD